MCLPTVLKDGKDQLPEVRDDRLTPLPGTEEIKTVSQGGTAGLGPGIGNATGPDPILWKDPVDYLGGALPEPEDTMPTAFALQIRKRIGVPELKTPFPQIPTKKK